MRRALIALWVAAALVPLWTIPSWACSCAQVSRPELGRLAEVVFAGRVLSVDEGEQITVATFGTDAVHKGRAKTTQGVSTSSHGPACGVEFQEAVRYTVFASRDEGSLHTNICTGTTRGNIDPMAFGLEGGRLLPGINAPPSPVAGWPHVAVAAGLVLATLIGLLVLRRRVRT